MADVTVRDATEADFEALTRLDLTYTVGDRYLDLERSGEEPELTYSMRWRTGTARERVYDTLTVDGLREALEHKTDAFLVAELAGEVVGYEMIVKPRFTDAAEITDLAVDRPTRRHGVGRPLVDAAAVWAKERDLRAVWVEPQGDAADTIDFYLKLGFRISGFNDRWNTNADGQNGRHTVYMYFELG